LANKAAIKAMLVNRIGDLALLIAISLIMSVFGSVKYNVIFSICSYFYDMNIYFLGFKLNFFVVCCLFLFIGAMGKSAQLGLHI